jgi:Protein of unknown function (DUF3253)
MKKLAGDSLASTHSDRCRVCALPLPAKPDDSGICSRRCAGRRGESEAIFLSEAALKQQVIVEISKLKRGSSVCPGELSQRLLPGTDQPLTVLRPLLYELAAARRIRLSQKGTLMLWEKIRGPFRVGPI